MQRDPRAFLWDVRESALAIQSFIAGMDMAAYAGNAMAQAAVERKFEIIGEALNQLSKFDAAASARIPDLAQIVAFRKNNPNYMDGKPCVYVGMTGLDPDVRFDKHKAGIQANSYVTKYGLRLLPDLYEGFNPMTYKDAVDKEIEVGIDLRSAGFGVWQA